MNLAEYSGWWLFPACALLSWMGVGVATRAARYARVLAEPGERQSHQVTTPSGGGAGLVAALLLVSLIPPVSFLLPAAWLYALLPGMVVLGITGWLDDRNHLPATLRLLIQLTVSLWLLVWLHTNAEEAAGVLPLAFWPVAALLLVGVINAFNFMDGSHGMAGMQALVSGLLLAAWFCTTESWSYSLAALAVSGAALGFLPWNFPRPRVFMGDAGSLALGFVLGGLVLAGIISKNIQIPTACLFLAVFLADAGLTLMVRVLKGERWYTAHRQHIYQRLIIAGWTHSRVCGLYLAINLLLVVPALIYQYNNPGQAWLITGMVALLLAILWTVAYIRLWDRT